MCAPSVAVSFSEVYVQVTHLLYAFSIIYVVCVTCVVCVVCVACLLTPLYPFVWLPDGSLVFLHSPLFLFYSHRCQGTV